MDSPPSDLKWSASLSVSPNPPANLTGDKILLPASALEALLAAAPLTDSPPDTHARPWTFNPHTYPASRLIPERNPTLPHPLTFRLVNPLNGRIVFAGIREFSAEEGHVVVSEGLRRALGLENADNTPRQDVAVNGDAREGSKISVIAKQLPKGTFVKLRPLEAGYDSDDWKALLEQHLRNNYTTLTKGDVLIIPGGSGNTSSDENFRFLVDEFRPDSDGICIVDTDLEVDIEALNEEQARETVKKRAAKLKPGTSKGSSTGGTIDLFQAVEGHVLAGEYVDYELSSWDRSQGLEIELTSIDEGQDIDLFVSPFSPRQRAKPRENHYVFAQFDGLNPKRIQVQHTNAVLEDAESIRIAIHSYLPSNIPPSSTPISYTLRVNPLDSTKAPQTATTHNLDEVQCKNCRQWVPARTLILHENFCYRNNILCPHGCEQVFQKSSSAWKDHWHCPHDSAWGNTSHSQSKHNAYVHTRTTCPDCGRGYSSLATLSTHRTGLCPSKLILCRFCHLTVPQEGDPDSPDPAASLSGLTPHELADGARTTDCHLCGKIVRLRDMRAHLAHHELSKSSRLPPRICANKLCGFSRDGTAKSGDTRVSRKGTDAEHDLGLCPRCFGPLYVSLHDPDGKALRRRAERRYLTQLVTGCGKSWCTNDMCRTGRANLGMPEQGRNIKEALPLVKPVVDALTAAAAVPGAETVPLKFCVDEACQRNRTIAEFLAAEGVYALEWCVGAVEAAGGELGGTREWLGNWAPKKI
jgi:Ubiquitin fusion degradation protein UFD1/Amino-terminal Zinc-binding domain of ubiquitin ligase E3A